MIFEKRYNQCQICMMKSMCKFKEDYYKNKGGTGWKEELYEDGKSYCKYAKRQGLIE